MCRPLYALAFVGLLTSCGTSSGPLSAGVGGEPAGSPPVEQYRGAPIVQLTFLTGIQPSIEATFLLDYSETGVERSWRPDIWAVADNEPPVYQNVRSNMNGMIAKNVFYAVHLAKYLKLRAGDDFKLILNPVSLGYDLQRGYFYEPLEKNLPPADVELSFLAYVHPNTSPSTRGEVLTTFGETIAPIVSVRVDPAFNPAHEGAVALTDATMPAARNPDGRGLRAQLADYINVRKHHHAARPISGEVIDGGPFEPGVLYRLEMQTFDLKEEPPEEELLSEDLRQRAGYDPGNYYAYEFYEGYYRLILSVLHHVDNRSTTTAAQKEYWAYFDDPQHLEEVLQKRTDRRKYGLLLRFQEAELSFLEDRDDIWIQKVLETADFSKSFKKLRDTEQEARNDYINAQIEAGVGVALAILGGVAAGYSASQDNSFGTAGGAAAVGVGLTMVYRATEEMEEIDTIFVNSLESSYASQKTYVIESVEGDRIEVRADSWGDFRQTLKQRYDDRFKRSPVPTPTTGTGNVVPTS